MFQRLKDKIFWKTQFDSNWRSAGTFFNFIRYSYPASQKIREKKYLWREEKGRFYSPRLAVFKAYEEFCNEYYRENHLRLKSESEFEEMGNALEFAAPYIDEDGKYQEREKSLSTRWLNYYNKHLETLEANKKKREEDATEVQSYRFDIAEIDAAWEQLKCGTIPKTAENIWRASYPRFSAHHIAMKSGVNIRDFVFWMCVFKRHLYYSEEIVRDTHMYCRPREHEELSSAISKELEPRKPNS